jgi:hypothetical protein
MAQVVLVLLIKVLQVVKYLLANNGKQVVVFMAGGRSGGAGGDWNNSYWL